MRSDPPNVFLSYSHQETDKAWAARLLTHLGVLEKERRLAVWSDHLLRAGNVWNAEIAKAIETADVAVLLITANFLTSRFIREQEVPRLLERWRGEELVIVPVILSSCPWQSVDWLEAMQVRPSEAEPLASFEGEAANRELALLVGEIEELIRHRPTDPSRPAEEPEPRYTDKPSRQLADSLAAAYRQLEELVSADQDTRDARETVLDLKRRLREEGQLKPGDFLAEGRYRLLHVLGRGGFSTVFKAYDRLTTQTVAVKALHTQYSQDKTRRDRFFRGARKMGELQHQGIVRVIESKNVDGGYHYFVMECIGGGDLQQAVRAGGIAGTRGLSILQEVAEALDFAHRHQVVHRDVKPANILLTSDGRAKLTDFDLVRAFDTTGGTKTGSLLGTVLYMAPEAMIAAEDAGVAADVYSLAMTAAFILHGAEIPPSVLRGVEGFLGSLEAPQGVKAALLRATAMESQERQPSVLELWTAIEEGMRSESIQEEAPLQPKRTETNSPAVIKPLKLEWSEGRDAHGEGSLLSVNGIKQRFRWIEPGTFQMGSPESEAGRFDREGPVHAVELTRGFWMADTPCTQALWEAVMGSNPSQFQSPQRPVETVSWHDCLGFIDHLNALSPDLDFRLPSEAEWEFACRAGTEAATWLGDLEIVGERNAPLLDEIAWYGGNSGVAFDLSNGFETRPWREKQHAHTRAGTREVRQRKANPWALYDMLGNVFEWCRDGQRKYRAEAVEDPEGPVDSALRVIRGGSWFSYARYVRAAYRYAREPGLRDDFLGFRLSRGPGGRGAA